MSGTLPEWELDGETISKRFVFTDFIDSISFVSSSEASSPSAGAITPSPKAPKCEWK